MHETSKIRQTIDAITSCLDSLKKNVDSISNLIQTESIVSSNVISDTMEELLKLKRSQDSLKKDYTELFPKKKCSELLNEIITEIDSYEAQLEEKKLFRKAEYITVKFSSIRSDIEECQKYLDEYYEQLKELSSKGMALEEYIKAVEPYDEFYKAVESESVDYKIEFSEKETLFSENYKFLLKMIQGKLYIDKSRLTDLDTFVNEDPNAPLQLSFETLESADETVIEPENNNEEPVSAENKEETETNSVPEPVLPDDTVSEEEHSEESATESEIVNEATDKEIAYASEFESFGITLNERTHFSDINVENNDDEQEVTPKAFKKEAEKFKNGNGFLLLAFSKYPYVTESVLKYGHQRQYAIDFSPMLESLLKSGYIKKDTIGDFPAMYSLTVKSLNALKGKTNGDWFKKIVPSPKKIWNFENTVITPSSEEYEQNRLLARVGYCEIQTFISRFFSTGSVSSSSSLSDEFYSSVNVFGKHKTSFYFLSCFLSKESSIAELLQAIEYQFAHIDIQNIEFSILVSDSVEECTSIMNYLTAKYDKFSTTRFYCYSVLDKKYFDVSSNEELTVEELITITTDYHKSKYKSASVKKDDSSEKTVPDAPSESSDEPETDAEQESLPLKESEDNNIPEEDPVSAIDEKKFSESLGEISDILADIADNDDNEAENTEPVIPADYSVIYMNQNISEEEILNNVYNMINSEKNYCASAYLGVVSAEPKYSNLKNELAFALNTPDKKGIYLSDVVMNIFDDLENVSGVFSDCLKVCAEMRVLFYNTAHHDYSYKQMYTVMKSLEPIESNSALADFVYKIEQFKTTNGIGIDAVADYKLKENIIREKEINSISKEAENLYDRYVVNPVREKCPLPRYVDMKKMIFKEKNQLSECLKIVAENSGDDIYVEYVREFINSNFIDENVEIKSENIKNHTIFEYVDKFWLEAGKIQRDKQASSKLVSSLRSNILNSVTKIVSVICDWYYYSCNSVNSSSMKGYDKDKNIIRTSLKDAITSIDRKIEKIKDDAELLAGYNCIRSTLSEFDSRMNGSYNETDVKYYYIDFLKYGDVILDDNYLPEFKGHNIAVNNFMPSDCILRHSRKADRSFEERLDEIFSRADNSITENLNDDYGCAQLIKNYYNDHNIEWDDENNNIEANTDEAIKQFKSCFENFKGSLELSQSYGQIDNDRKEQMLAMVNIQFIKNETAHNFGYFSRLLSYVEETIKFEAKNREKSLRANLETVAVNSENSEFSEIAKSFIEEARKMLERQNYTVAEDLIHRIQNNDFENNTAVFDEDNFADFIDEYSSNYKVVSNSSGTLKKIIQNSKRPMKDTKRGASLIDNFPTGSQQNPDKIKNLLLTLGFPVDKVSVDATTQKNYNSYSIELIKNTNGKKENYTHPIAPFGSLAEENGFRVICLFGMFDARRLIDKFKEIGTSRHTMVILDYALNAPERRTLARKIKEEISDKIFIVVDRVAIFYLANHYTENTVNRVLMEITMPYSSFQPYSIDSARPIPVEMFMGRKDQLEDIESPNGANIISGGRQLGKSALLRMAKSDIDKNENGDRAIYVEIKDCDCKRAAEKISAALVDEGILDEGSETSEWKVLSRAIKKRLNSQTDPKIPYLLLLIDEADTFIDDCKNYKYEPLDDLEDIQSVGVNRFKFVVAGLRNLVKFEKEKSMANNSGIAHLSQKTIRPFTYTEACELLEKPLHYLGIRFPKNESYLVSLILATTNYFPGLIHFYCAKLIEAVKKYDPVFDETSSPPYNVTESHIKRVLADPEFRKQIKEKFEITLKLDTDNFYHIIVVLMAYCHYTTESPDGYSPDEIYSTADDYDITKIRKLDISKLTALMDELCELNILRKNPNGKYLFARYNFLQLLGTSAEIEEMILRYSEEE